MSDRPLDLDGLEAVARAATPGTWTVEKSVFADRVVLRAGNWSTGPLVPADAAFIAAANPSTVLRLVEMARLGEQLAEAFMRYDASYGATVRRPGNWSDVKGRKRVRELAQALAAKLRKPEGAE